MYASSSYNLFFITFYKKSNYEKQACVKFSNVKKNKFITSTLGDVRKKMSLDWDIAIVKFAASDKKKEDEIKRLCDKKTPLYPIFYGDYMVITKILFKQLPLTQKRYTVREIMELYLFEIGAILSSTDTQMSVNKKISSNCTLNEVLSQKDLQFISPKMHGWFGKYTELCIQYVLENYPYNNFIELGSWFGKSTGFILQHIKPDADLYCFDKFQNVMKSEFTSNSRTKIDDFYLGTPRYETFCRNISPYVAKNKKCFTVKYDVNDYLSVLSKNSIVPSIVFIDAVKSTPKLIRLIENTFDANRDAVIVGDDNVFESVQRAVDAIIEKHKKINVFITDDCYIMTFLPIEINKVNKFIKKNYFTSPQDEMYYYEVVYHYLFVSKEFDKIINVLKKHDIDLNKPLEKFNNNTLFNYFYIVFTNNEPSSKINNLKKFILQNYEPKKIKSVLGLDYTDYKKKGTFF